MRLASLIILPLQRYYEDELYDVYGQGGRDDGAGTLEALFMVALIWLTAVGVYYAVKYLARLLRRKKQ